MPDYLLERCVGLLRHNKITKGKVTCFIAKHAQDYTVLHSLCNRAFKP